MIYKKRKARGSDLVISALANSGVQHLFTLSGNQILSLYDASIGSGIHLIHARSENAAVYMADAWARLSGTVGVALVSAGPGHANTLASLYTAAAAESPVVLLSGHAPLLSRGSFQELAQVELATPVAKAAWQVSDAAQLSENIAKAIRIAKSNRPGPVHLSLPMDVLESTVEPSSVVSMDSSSVAPGPTALDGETAHMALRFLSAASRPLVLTGPMLCTPRGREAAETLEKALNVPVIGMESPRGLNDPSLGNFATILRRADRLLLLGKKIDYMLKFAGASVVAPECRLLSLAPDDDAGNTALMPPRAADSFMLRTGVDPYGAARTLASMANAPVRSKVGWYATVREAIACRPQTANTRRSPAGLIHPLRVCHAVQAVLNPYPEAILVSDGGEFCQWMQAGISTHRRIINGPAGTIGCALPFAIAARLVEPRAPIVAVTGDGALGFHIAEFDTAVRYGLPLVVIVGNDARWNTEYQLQARKYGSSRLIGCELLPTRYEKVAAALGGYGEYVERADELENALHRALASKLPACINVPIECAPAPSISPNQAPGFNDPP